MIHPYTEIKKVNDIIGLGVFATRFIPRGTITFAVDQLDLQITPEQLSTMTDDYRLIIDKYAYVDEKGNSIVSWDHGKYVNHSCTPNTMSTGYGFEIAIRDILPGEEITDDYGLFNLTEPMPVSCCSEGCRGHVLPNDIDTFADSWDALLKVVLKNVQDVDQPLLCYLNDQTIQELNAFLANDLMYKSVRQLKYEEAAEMVQAC